MWRPAAPPGVRGRKQEDLGGQQIVPVLEDGGPDAAPARPTTALAGYGAVGAAGRTSLDDQRVPGRPTSRP